MDTTYYATVAQVVPVIFLALVFEVRGAEDKGDGFSFSLVTTATLLLLVAEGIALNVVKTGKSDAHKDDVLLFALILGVVPVLIEFINRQLKHFALTTRHRALVWVILTAIVIAFWSYAAK